ncbi:MAG TPA: chaplin family protein [Acidimicrobiales bacterium]
MRRLGLAAAVATGLVLAVGVTPTQAQESQANSSAEGDGVLAGNSVAADVDAPVTLCGLINGLGVAGVGVGFSICGPGDTATGPSVAQSSASGDGVATGNSAAVDIDAPIDVNCLVNGVGVLGLGVGGCIAPAAAPSCGAPCPPPPSTCCPPPTTCCPPPTTCPCPTTTTTPGTTSSSSTTSTPGGSTSSTTPPPPGPPELPQTGGDIGLEVPVAAGLLAGGGLCVWASRRRMARLAALDD